MSGGTASDRLKWEESQAGSATPLDWSLLKQVSRSFYLTLRLLPSKVREPISLAYLLARLSDTEADGAVSEAERELLTRRPQLERALAASPDRAEIEKVWTTIQEGQRFDSERFSHSEQPALSDQNPPLSPAELDRYTYLVAGCVGEFWTEICAKKLPGFARLPVGEMQSLGIRYGQGLQLVNILRDRAADAAIGRAYVPPHRLNETFLQARHFLADAERYTRALTTRRLRSACALPFLMGRETLSLVEKNPDVAKMKLTRNRVWWLLVKSLGLRGSA